eukprot:874827_1
MADQNKFDTDQVKAISKPSMDILRRLTYALYVELEHGPDADINVMETDAKVPESISPEQCKQLVFDTKAVAGMVVDTVKPHMKPENTQLLRDTFDVVVNDEFFEALMFDPEFADDKKEMYRNLHEMMIYGDDDYAASTHVKILSKSEFGDRYSAAIRVIREVWENVTEDEQEFGDLILSKLLEQHPEYEAILPSCKYGDDRSKQALELVKLVGQCYFYLEKDWPDLCLKMQALGREHGTWAPGMPKEGYGHFFAAVRAAGREQLGQDFKQRKDKYFSVVIKHVIEVLEDSY